MNRNDLFHRLDFHQNQTFYEEVDSERVIDFEPFVFDWQGNLSDESDATKNHLLGQACFVRRLQQTWSEPPVNFNRSTNYFA